MSEVAGRLAPQVGAHGPCRRPMAAAASCWAASRACRRRKVVVIGGGVVGTHAAKIAVGMGAQVTVVDRSIGCAALSGHVFGGSIQDPMLDPQHDRGTRPSADLIIGAVLVPGAAAPKLITRTQLKDEAGLGDRRRRHRPGRLLRNLARDDHACRPDLREVDGVMHYCVANMPGAVARTSTLALGNATMPALHVCAGQTRAGRPARACCWPTTCSRPVAPCSPRMGWRSSCGPRWPARRC
jgi:alanine dehydrogenase